MCTSLVTPTFLLLSHDTTFQLVEFYMYISALSFCHPLFKKASKFQFIHYELHLECAQSTLILLGKTTQSHVTDEEKEMISAVVTNLPLSSWSRWLTHLLWDVKHGYIVIALQMTVFLGTSST